MHEYVHIITISEKRDLELQSEQGGAYKSISREDREGRNVIIIL